ncbi:hypothetical protein VB713_20245 [Anabaena cylindrica UHCC 0172]|uniref:hypothetical protein n=1 Tax=Anabaena cylindrica TaxID=1165 RepID=UPI002B2079E0|nr:hypothetical protein [Anabaena cylindrica]MEA5553274.1 hypothetical protein [Anabaena cylindrica UHCC 0172]
MSDPITLTTFFGISKAGGDIFIKISQALGLIESIESKLDCLMQVEFNAAWKTLIQACNSSALEQQRDILINDARNGFNKATCIQKGEKLFSAYLGLAICHYLLNDMNNVKAALLEATKISIYSDIYLQERDSSFGFNKYGVDSAIKSYNHVYILNLIKGIFAYPLVSAQTKEIKKYNKFKTNSVRDIAKKINAERKIITLVTKAEQPSDVFKRLETKALELIRLQKECLEIVINI